MAASKTSSSISNLSLIFLRLRKGRIDRWLGDVALQWLQLFRYRANNPPSSAQKAFRKSSRLKIGFDTNQIVCRARASSISNLRPAEATPRGTEFSFQVPLCQHVILMLTNVEVNRIRLHNRTQLQCSWNVDRTSVREQTRRARGWLQDHLSRPVTRAS
jgi:hypothetical protein